jgi:ABC-type transport system involved in cytochrome bd biosynthesis fused ATPase/permease subunit
MEEFELFNSWIATVILIIFIPFIIWGIIVITNNTKD